MFGSEGRIEGSSGLGASPIYRAEMEHASREGLTLSPNYNSMCVKGRLGPECELLSTEHTCNLGSSSYVPLAAKAQSLWDPTDGK